MMNPRPTDVESSYVIHDAVTGQTWPCYLATKDGEFYGWYIGGNRYLRTKAKA